MKKITLSISMIVFVGLIVIGATTAFFSDTETSTGNTFSAGEIDLLVGNDSYMVKGDSIEKMDNNTWDIQSDIAGDDRLFFDFEDIKPGDLAEDMISLRVDTNDAWACMKGDITDSTSGGHPDATNDEGHLHEEIQMVFWADDGDNVYENDETEKIVWEGTADELFDGNWKTITDSDNSVFDDLGDNGELLGGKEYHLAKAWCHGELKEAPVEEGNENPEDRGETGFTCDGEDIGNASQGDSFGVDVDFYAVQSRNNDDFRCDEYNDNDDEEREITGTPQDTWSTATENKDWIAKGRYGGENTYELEVGFEEEENRSEDEHTWPNDQTEEFELTYDGDSSATLTVGDDTSTYDNVTTPDPDSFLALIAKTDDRNDNGTSVEITDVKIDGISPTGSDNVYAETTEDSREINSLDLTGDLELTDGFSLTGKVKFNYGSNPINEGPAFEIVIGQGN